MIKCSQESHRPGGHNLPAAPATKTTDSMQQGVFGQDEHRIEAMMRGDDLSNHGNRAGCGNKTFRDKLN